MNDDRRLAESIREIGINLGFDAVGFSNIELDDAEIRLIDWLQRSYHGEMSYMSRHGRRRSRPAALVPGTVSIVSVRLNYLTPAAAPARDVLAQPQRGFIARYALGRDYHKLIRRRLQILADRIGAITGPFAYRAFTDSAPVMEKPIAQKAGLGWIGKHTNLLARDAGSWFFIGELYTDLDLPDDQAGSDHCGTCRRCIDACPTNAIVAPYQLDARRCIAYHTIELHGPIPVEFRRAIGNRIFGCDDCQLVCPWNHRPAWSVEEDFLPRNDLDNADLVALFAWQEQQFDERTVGTVLRRLGYERWLRNIAIGLGNAPTTPQVLAALKSRENHPSALVREHVEWALAQHEV